MPLSAEVETVPAATAPATMKVTVVDRFQDHQRWGHGNHGLPLRTVEIGLTCPTCGGPRGPVRQERMCDDGEFYWISRWDNPCGHIDKYGAVLREAGIYTGDEQITNQGSTMGRRQADF